MPDSTLAKFEASVSGTPFEHDRVAVVSLTTERLTLTHEEESVTVPLSRVFDFVVRFAEDSTENRELAVGTRADDQRGVIVVRADGDSIQRFRLLFAKGLLNGTACEVRREERAFAGGLTVRREGIAVGEDDRSVRIRYDSIRRLGREGDAVVIHVEGGSVVVSFESARRRNLFVRHVHTTPAVESSSSSEPTVLVVDDEPNLAELVCHRLSALTEGYEFVAVDDPTEALERADDVDGVISDYAMPQLDGLELLRRVRDRAPELPFILFTGRGSESIAAEAIGEGVTDYVSKSMGDEGYSRLAQRVESAV
jgi:CheY-like chemotaxis protein